MEGEMPGAVAYRDLCPTVLALITLQELVALALTRTHFSDSIGAPFSTMAAGLYPPSIYTSYMQHRHHRYDKGCR
jgi:hypothetical protein